MKLLADENIPLSMVRILMEGGYDILWIRTESPGISDIEVIQAACQDNRVILTYDKDFGELAIRDNLYPPPGIILLRFPMNNPLVIAKKILNILNSRTDWVGHFSVIEETKIRMRPLPSL
jgi:predicted nuclease of predicted toxin-antitoxin system